MCISFKQSNSLLHVQLSWLVPFETEKKRLACMGYFCQGNMQMHPLFHGSMFSKWRLHARMISETSHQVLLSRDLWHACHNLDVISTHQLDATELIPHTNLVALTSHITSRSSWHIQLSCFEVSSLPMPCVIFMSLFCVFACMSIFCLISLNACFRLHVY